MKYYEYRSLLFPTHFVFNTEKMQTIEYFYEQHYIVAITCDNYIRRCTQTHRCARNQCYLPTLLILECLVCSNPFLPMNDFVSVCRGFPRGPHERIPPAHPRRC